MASTAVAGEATTTVIFLDVDGVLHPADERQRPCRKPCMDALKAIIQRGQGQICLSSNWRLDDWGIGQINSHLRKHGLEPIAGHTHPEEDHFNTRADEILDWLHRHPEVAHFVVLDDVPLNFEDPESAVPACISEHFVQTDERIGLQDEDVGRALACLERAIDRSEHGLDPARLYCGHAVLPVPATPQTVSALSAPAVTAVDPIDAAAVTPPSQSMRPAKRIPSCTLLTSLCEMEAQLLAESDASLSTGIRRVASRERLAAVSLSRRSSRGDLQGLVRD